MAPRRAARSYLERALSVRKLTLQMQMSVDGYIAASPSGFRWQLWTWGDDWPWDDVLIRDFNAALTPVDCILLSRPMAQEGYIAHWETMARRHDGDPRFAFAKRVTDVRKVICTTTPIPLPWPRTERRGGPLAEAVSTLKREPGGDILVYGGASFARSLLELGLVDELQLYVNPAPAGTGTPLFGTSVPVPLSLLDATPYACGIVVARYAPGPPR